MWSVFFVFLSYLDRNLVKGDFLDVEKEGKGMFSMLNGTFCAKMSAAGENFLYQVSDGTEVLRSVVSPSGRMVNCSVTVNHTQVKSFTHKCRLEPKEQKAAGGQQPETRFTRMDEAKVMCREFKLRSGDRMERGGTEDPELQNKVLKRSKRGFTYPGTLWCGAGNMADNYDQLGTFAETDSCCRTHDHCPHVIHAFSTKYGYTNFKWHSICHCDCDNALRNCLKRVNDSSSRVIGQAFFNVIGVPCFEFVYEEQCAERHWYGTSSPPSPPLKVPPPTLIKTKRKAQRKRRRRRRQGRQIKPKSREEKERGGRESRNQRKKVQFHPRAAKREKLLA
uniref:phospholipase A2 n=1 Tax=Echeneis naucrates TaxID=173247 RepID=A0A665T2F8_ECHNA